MNKPIKNSYWVIERKFLAGEYPGSKAELKAFKHFLKAFDIKRKQKKTVISDGDGKFNSLVHSFLILQHSLRCYIIHK